MQFIALCKGLFYDLFLTKTNLRIMKLSAVILFACSLHVSATATSQKITFSGKKISIESIFHEVKKQTGYLIFCSYDLLDKTNSVTVNAKGIPLEIFLKEVLKDQNLDFAIENKTILILQAQSPPEKKDLGGQTITSIPPPIEVKGKILNKKGEPLVGATINLKGSNKFTTADENGNFNLTVPNAGSKLVISYIGFETIEITIANESPLTLTLKEKDADVDEVVVIGYGSQKKSDLTGAVSSINMRKIEEIPIVSIDQILSGRAPGLQITQNSGKAGAGTSIRIRGGNSLNGTNEPLFVVDGFPIINDNNSFAPSGPVGLQNPAGGTNQENPNGALNWLNPDDIQSIEILKDASATAIYGSRGANGVVIITTKKGRSGEARINLTTSIGMNTFNDENIKLMNGSEYANYLNLSNQEQGLPVFYKDTVVDGKLYPTPDKIGAGTNWLDAITQKGLMQNYSIGFTGGNDVLYSGSVSWLDQETALQGSRFKRLNFRLNFQTDLTKWLTLENSTMFGNSITDNSPTDTRDIQKFGAFEAALLANPAEPIYKEDGTLNANGTGDPSNILKPGIPYSPLALVSDVLNKNTTQTLLDNLSLKLHIVKGINFEVRGSIFRNNSLKDIYYSQKTFNGAAVGGLAGKNSNNVNSYQIEYFGSVNKTFGQNEFSSVLGYSYQKTEYRTVTSGASGFPNDNLKNENLASGSTQYPTQTNRIEDLLSSYFIRLNNILLKKYLFTFTARMDGSSKFGSGNKWAFFPSGAISWKLKEEDFLQNSKVFSDLKLRISYGLSGNQAIQSLQSKTSLGINNYPIGNVLLTGVFPEVLGNPNLKWETTKQFNAGLDFGLLDQRITGSLDYYIKNTEDLLQSRVIPINSGFGSQLDNMGTINNKGIELGLHVAAINRASFRWDIDLNIARNKQKFTDLGFNDIDTMLVGFTAVGGQEAPIVALIKDKPVGVFYGYRREGIYQTQDEIDNSGHLPGATPGSYRFKDLNGDGIFDDQDREIIGDPNPDYIYGIINNFTYKQFDLNILVQGVIGGNIYNVGQGRQLRLGNLPSAYLDYWSHSNLDAKYSAPGKLIGAYSPSDGWIESASYLRLKAITFGYNFPTGNLKFVRNIRLYASAANILTITDYSGFDPEGNNYGQSNLFRNIDNLTIPLNKTYTVGLNVGF